MSKVYMRYGRWKLFKDEKELYDILTDMGEFYNLVRFLLALVS